MDKEYYANFRDAKLISVIKVEVNEGNGSNDDPIRRVAYYIDAKTGSVLFHTTDRERKFAGGDAMLD
jgi:hypothetical protein